MVSPPSSLKSVFQGMINLATAVTAERLWGTLGGYTSTARVVPCDFRERGVMVAYCIWDAGERFESDVFYFLISIIPVKY